MEAKSQIIAWAAVLLLGCTNPEDVEKTAVPAVTKKNPMKVYMHYMPWYQSKPLSGYWGSHWRMNTKDPEQMDATGKRQIASHYYPLIGPYDSKDPSVIEYHLLLMKYAGVDAVVIDWYGSHNVNDYRQNLNGSNALIEKMDDVGLQFAIAYEDYTAEKIEEQTGKPAVEAAQTDVAYLQAEYFGKPEYVTILGKPLLLTFGPRYFTLESQWTKIFSALNPKPSFVPLWHHAHRVGENGNGEFSWVDFTPALSELSAFYDKAGTIPFQMGSAFPRFHDFYQEGGWGESYGYVDFDNGQVLRNTLATAQAHNIEHLQLVTWNDFGEGTVLEPTLEDGFLCLEILQEFTGVPYGRAELELVHDYYMAKVKHLGNTSASEKLNAVFIHLSRLEVEKARAVLAELQ